MTMLVTKHFLLTNQYKMIMQPELPIADYQFTYEAKQKLNVPHYSGALWHGVFGRALKQLVCVTNMDQCDPCMFLYQCDYPYLFRGPRPPDSDLMRKYSTIPVPHIFRVDDTTEHTLQSNQHFSVKMVLTGSANNKLPAIIKAMYAAGIAGLGKQRIECQLIDIMQTGPQQQSDQLMSDGRFTGHAHASIPEASDLPNQVQLEYLTPYKPSGALNTQKIDVTRFIMAVIRRISLLQYFYTGKQLDADFRQLKITSELLSINNEQLHWQHYQRYSASHGKAIDTSGWLGRYNICLENCDCIWPYLWLGQWLGAGKNASMGFGRYQLNIKQTSLL
jgi:hypothetical protein